jgi:hypothetical protein
MRDAVAVTTAQQTDVVHAFRDVRQPFGHLGSGLSPRPKLTQRSEQVVPRHFSAGLEFAERFRDGLSGQPNQVRFVIEEIHVTGTSGHEKEDHVLGWGVKVRTARREWIGDVNRSWRRAGKQSFAAEHGLQGEQTESTAGSTEKVPSIRSGRGD